MAHTTNDPHTSPIPTTTANSRANHSPLLPGGNQPDLLHPKVRATSGKTNALMALDSIDVLFYLSRNCPSHHE